MVKARWVICMMWHVDNITLEPLEALEVYGVFDVLMNKSLLSS